MLLTAESKTMNCCWGGCWLGGRITRWSPVDLGVGTIGNFALPSSECRTYDCRRTTVLVGNHLLVEIGGELESTGLAEGLVACRG